MNSLLPERLLSTRIISKDDPIAFTTIIRADNVLDYVDQVRMDSSVITNVAPPMNNMFIQFHLSEKKMGVEVDMGVHIMAERLRDKANGIEWELTASFWTEPNAHRYSDQKPFIWWIIHVKPDGSVKELVWEKNEEWWLTQSETAFREYNKIIAGVLFAINLMNCKNVIVEEQPATSREKRMEKHGKPTFRYHLLKVRKANKLYEIDNPTGEKGEYSTHICRGHFKTFTDEAPLLGRFVGTYWWDAHVRGRDKSHVVDKDYLLESEATS